MSQSRHHAALRRLANKPHYLFRPGQTMRRLRYAGRRWEVDRTMIASLPWRIPLECWPTDMIGSSVLRTGVYDLLATEAVFRLADPGETAVDAGANIGYMTSALARTVGELGDVLSFEPHPDVHAVLERNAARWKEMAGLATIRVHQLALSDRGGAGAMATDHTFSANHGIARVVTEHERRSAVHVPITLARLDELTQGPVGVLKLDVEGHELRVIQGAEALTRRGAVRDIIFEEHDPYPTHVTDRLEQVGFEIFGLRQRLSGPELSDPLSAHQANPWDPPVLIATIDRDRLRARFGSRGWIALRPNGSWTSRSDGPAHDR